MFFGSTSDVAATAVVYQSDIAIPSGTVVDCSAWVFASIGIAGTLEFQLTLDGQNCGDVLRRDVTSDYARIGGRLTVTGELHRVQITVVSSGVDWYASFNLDDVSVIPVAATDGCVSTTLAPPVETV